MWYCPYSLTLESWIRLFAVGYYCSRNGLMCWTWVRRLNNFRWTMHRVNLGWTWAFEFGYKLISLFIQVCLRQVILLRSRVNDYGTHVIFKPRVSPRTKSSWSFLKPWFLMKFPMILVSRTNIMMFIRWKGINLSIFHT